MNSRIHACGGAVIALLAVSVGCGDSASTGGAGGTGSTTTNTTSKGATTGATTTSSKAATGTGTTTATSTSTGGGGPTCAAYCASIQTNCTGNNAQYSTIDNCMASCLAIPVGTTADVSGNTLGCRTYHAGAASGDAVLHCPHAGPGGDGTCGTPCDGYCQIAQMYCAGANQVYTSAQDCQTTCATAMTDIRYTVLTTTGPEVACLLYHVQEASTVPADHCPGDLIKDAGGPSLTCQ